MPSNKSSIIAVTGPITIAAAETEEAKKGPRRFEVLAYTGGILAGALRTGDNRENVVVDLAGMSHGKSLVANLDHESKQRVGNVTSVNNDGTKVTLAGVASAATPFRDEVINSANDGFVWQASIEAQPTHLEPIKAGKSVTVNGQKFEGPLFVARKSVLKGFAFVSHGADDNSQVTIAAGAASSKETKTMRPEVKAWAEGMGIDVDNISDERAAVIEANYDGKTKKPTKPKFEEGFEAKKAEADRVEAITDIALTACDKRPYEIQAIKELGQKAIDDKWTIDKFRLELIEASLPQAHTVFSTKKGDPRMNSRVIEAALCMTGRLEGYEKMFDDQTLQAAHEKFKNGIGLKQLFLICAESNGYHGSYASDINIEVQRAAFGMQGPQIRATGGWSTLSIATILSNTANKYLREGWEAVDDTAMRIAAIRSVRDFKEITTVSLTGDLMFEKVGAAGEIKHGTLGQLTYGNKVDTYAKMLAITRQDMINDDVGALTSVPRRLGRGSKLKLNDIFWTEFLDNGSFFTSGNANVNTGVADMTVGGLAATEAIFTAQTDPNGKPLGAMPTILLVPTALKAAAMTLMSSERLIDGTGTTIQGDANIWRGRFRVESSPYMSNSAYTGYSASAWYMLASPGDLPVIEIAALNGRVEPVVETADADFNVLGVQMRGYSDVGVRKQEYRGGVRADGGSS